MDARPPRISGKPLENQTFSLADIPSTHQPAGVVCFGHGGWSASATRLTLGGKAHMQPATTHAVRDLRIGQPLDHDLFDRHGVLLLRGGTVITQRFVDALLARGISEVSSSSVPTPAETDPVEPASPPQADTPISRAAKQAWNHVPRNTPDDLTAYALTGRERPPLTRLSAEHFEDAAAAAERHVRDALDRWAQLGPDLAGGRVDNAGPAAAMLDGLLPAIAADVDLSSVMLRFRGYTTAPILRHGVRCAVMSMHLARQVGYAPDRVVDAGLVGLLADLGMTRVPQHLLDAPRTLTPNEWMEVKRHPAYSADTLEHVQGLRPDIATAVLQHHERLDGSGYPSGRSGFYTHPLAKLVAVADTYAAVADDRAHRQARSAHHAVRAVLDGVKANRLDRDAGKVLLETVTLFPVGTVVTLSDDTRAVVVRTIDDHPDRPLLQLVDERGELTRRKIDLSVRDELKVVKVHDPEPVKLAA